MTPWHPNKKEKSREKTLIQPDISLIAVNNGG